MVTITRHPDGDSFDCGDGDTILRAALRAGIGMHYSCNTGSCGNCRFDLIEGAVEHLRADPPAWSERDLKRHRWLGCQARPLGDCQVKFRTDPRNLGQFTPAGRGGELVSVTPLTHDISEFALHIEGDDGFLPGQYALLSVPGVEAPRAYSMSNLPGENIWRFLIKKSPGGAATGWLFDHAQTGDQVMLDGPYGIAWLREEIDRDLVLIAGGSGLSPIVSIAGAAAVSDKLSARHMHVFYGGRRQADLFDEGLFDFGHRATLLSALSEPDRGWEGPAGFLHDVVRDELGDTLKNHEIYFAGPAAMSAALQKMAYEAGAPMDQLHFDEFY